eukprot:g8870.t1
MSTDTVSGRGVPSVGDTNIFISPSRCLNRRCFSSNSWGIRPSPMLLSNCTSFRQSGTRTGVLVLDATETGRKQSRPKQKSLKRRSASNRRMLKRVLREPSSIGVFGALMLAASIQIFQKLFDPFRAEELTTGSNDLLTNVDDQEMHSLTDEGFVGADQEDKKRSQIKEVLDSMDDMIEYMDTSIHKVPVSERTPSLESESSLDHTFVTPTASGDATEQVEDDLEMTEEIAEAVEIMTESIVGTYCTEGEERIRAKEDDACSTLSEAANSSLDSLSLEVTPSENDPLDDVLTKENMDVSGTHIEGENYIKKIDIKDSERDKNRLNSERKLRTKEFAKQARLESRLEAKTRIARSIGVVPDSRMKKKVLVRKLNSPPFGTPEGKGRGQGGSNSSNDANRERLISTFKKNGTDRIGGTFRNYLIPVAAGLLVGSVAMRVITGTNSLQGGDRGVLTTTSIVDHQSQQAPNSRRSSIYDEYEVTDESDVDLDEFGGNEEDDSEN